MMSDTSLFKVIFLNQGQVYEVYARSVSQGGLLGFVEVEDLVFDERTQLVVDPSEESLKAEFEGVRRVYLPMHAVVRIDEVERQGPPRIREAKKDESTTATVMPFPVPTPPEPSRR